VILRDPQHFGNAPPAGKIAHCVTQSPAGYFCMKTLNVWLALTMFAAFPGSLGARDLMTKGGDIFRNITIVKKDALGVRIAHDDGFAFVDFMNLNEADQKEFGYDPAAYTVVILERAATEKRQRERALAAQKIAGTKPAPTVSIVTPVSPSIPAATTGVQATVETPRFNLQTYRSDGTVFSTGTPPAMGGTPFIRGFVRPDGTEMGPLIIRRR
jgi:hypothetical protein